MPSEHAEATLRRVRAALAARGDDYAGLIVLFHQLTVQAAQVSIDELAELIGKHETLAAKILRAANSIAYNPLAISVKTLSEAVNVIGFSQVRQLAIALTLAEGAVREGPEAVRLLASRALVAGMCSEQAAKLSGEEETATYFLAATLRHYGKLMLASFAGGEGDEALVREAEGLSVEEEDERYIEAFGITPLQLSYHLLCGEQLPAELMGALKQFDPQEIHHTVREPSSQALAFARFGETLSALVTDPEQDPTRFAAAAGQALQKHRTLFGRDLEVGDLLQHVERRTREIERLISDGNDPTPLFRAVAARRAGRPVETGPTPASHLPPARAHEIERVAQDASLGSAQKPTTQAATVRPLLGLAAWLRDQRADGSSLVDLLPTTIAQYEDATGADEVLLMARDSNGSFAAMAGDGLVYKAAGHDPVFTMSESNLFTIALRRREEIYVERVEPSQLARYFPRCLREDVPLSSFLLLPLIRVETPVGLLLLGRLDPPAIQADRMMLTEIRQVNRQLAEML